MHIAELARRLNQPLRDEQLQHAETLSWLLDNTGQTRAEGKTYLMALTFLRLALGHPGEPIAVFDHHPATNGTLLTTLRNLIQRMWDPNDWAIEEGRVVGSRTITYMPGSE